MTDNLVGFITVHPHKPIMKAYAARRLAAKDRNGLADPEDIAIELGKRAVCTLPHQLDERQAAKVARRHGPHPRHLSRPLSREPRPRGSF